MKFITLFIIVLAMSLSACGSDSSSESSSSAKPTSLSGSWESGDPAMIAHISGGNIQIDIVEGNTESGTTSALYWKGTFPTTASDGDKFTSKADTEELESAILGSSDSTKVFTFKDGKLSFKFGIMGTTTIVNLER